MEFTVPDDGGVSLGDKLRALGKEAIYISELRLVEMRKGPTGKPLLTYRANPMSGLDWRKVRVYERRRPRRGQAARGGASNYAQVIAIHCPVCRRWVRSRELGRHRHRCRSCRRLVLITMFFAEPGGWACRECAMKWSLALIGRKRPVRSRRRRSRGDGKAG